MATLACCRHLALLLVAATMSAAAKPIFGQTGHSSQLQEEVRAVAVTLKWDGWNPSCIIQDSPDASTVAIASYTNSVNTSGWGVLTVNTTECNLGPSAADQAFAAGCAEAAVTFQEMFAYWSNYAAAEYGANGPSANLTSFMQQQLTWVRGQLNASSQRATAAAESTFWYGMSLAVAQFDGLVYYQQNFVPAEFKLDEITVYMLNSVGDLEDLNGLFAAPSSPIGLTQAARVALHEARNGVHRDNADISVDPIPLHDKLTDCSALVRVLPDLSDVLIGHTTWRSYYAMLRIYKVYAFSFFDQSPISFSSSPGLIHSKDDFYVTPRFVSMETTNSVFNHTLYELYITPASALSWQRAYISNGWATSGAHWVELFAMYNSGTYNNQWMVVDKKRFTPGSMPSQGYLYIIEQIPGTTQAQDVTSILIEQTNWPSYNIPFLPGIYNLSGYPGMVQKYGAQYTYENCSRANIFRRNHTDVEDILSLRALLRYNNYETDPLAGGDPILGSVSSRGDLRTAPVAFGGVDTKVTSSLSMEVLAESGPTYDQQPFFAWGNFTSFASIQHVLVPEIFHFPTISISP